jgi:gas vesicle protein
VAPERYKASLTYIEGWRLLGTLMIGGHQAVPKAQRVGDSILKRVQRLLTLRHLPDFSQTSLEVLGAESTYGPHSRGQASREVVLKIAAKHSQREALELLAKEIAPSATSMAQGITGFAAGRPSPSQVVRLFSCLIDATRLTQRVCLDGQDIGFVPKSVGAALGVLFAPDKGSVTRKKLMGGAKDLADDLKQKMMEEANVFRARAEELEAIDAGKIADISHNMNQNLDA